MEQLLQYTGSTKLKIEILYHDMNSLIGTKFVHYTCNTSTILHKLTYFAAHLRIIMEEMEFLLFLVSH